MRDGPAAGSGATMNGAVYMSFFQGQLEAALERAAQLAVQEISRTAGASLHALLLEAAAREQETRRLRLQLQAREGRPGGGPGGPGGGPGAGGGRPADGPDQPGPPQEQQHPGGQGGQTRGGQGGQTRGAPDTRRLQQRGRIVDQLRAVMEHVLSFAVRELTKIVEASFDDLLLEITKMEAEQQALEERLGKAPRRGGRGAGPGGCRRRSENDSASPSGSEDARVELAEVTSTKEEVEREDPEPLPVLSMSQDWTPVLDKVFGQRWSNDNKEQDAAGSGGRGLYEGGDQGVQPGPASPLALEPTPSSPQQDPRWTPLEDMEVFSPDDGPTESQRRLGGGATGEGAGSSGRRSSASMLHRLLTLPSQLMEDEDATAAAAREKQAAPVGDDNGGQDGVGPSSPAARAEEEEEEEEEEDGQDKGRKKKRRRVWSECGECGQRFSRKSLLKSHRQTHASDHAAAEAPASSPASSPPADGPASTPRYAQCGRRAAHRAPTGPGAEAARAPRGWTYRIRPDQNQNP